MSQYIRTVPAPGGTYPLAHYEVARMGFGAMQLRKLEANPGTAESLLRRALELGVDHIDTAQFYGNGFVNKIIGKALPAGDTIVVASKVGRTTIRKERSRYGWPKSLSSFGRVLKTISKV
jgi:pyridoxine 4-dehydrogenase